MPGEEPSSRSNAPSARTGALLRWRVLLGAALVTVAAGGVVFAHRSAQRPPQTHYLVLTTEIGAGEAVGPAQLGSVAIDLPGAIDAVAAAEADDVIGRLAVHSLAPNTLLAAGDLVEPGRFERPGEIEVAVSLDPSRAPMGAVSVGDVVRLLSTSEDRGTHTLSGSARVTRIEGEDDGGTIGGGSRLRVGLALADIDQAIATVDAAVGEDLTVVLPAPGSTESP